MKKFICLCGLLLALLVFTPTMDGACAAKGKATVKANAKTTKAGQPLRNVIRRFFGAK